MVPRPLLAAALVLAFVACSEAVPVQPAPPPSGDRDAYGELPREVAGFHVTRGAAPGYVADQACKECHGSIYESYQSVGMARSFYRLTKETAVERFGETFVQKETGYRYAVVPKDGKHFQRRWCVDRSGARFAEHEVEIAWVIGSGNHARTYVSQTGRGELFQMPVTWYSGKGWGMSPGFEARGHDRFERQIQRGCMFCHNAYPEVPVGSDMPDQPHLFPKEMPHGIGCQRCHGPGARHVEAASDEDASAADVVSRIVNPGHMPPQQQEEVCMTCHMQPDVSSSGDSTSRAFDRPVYSHRPDRSIMDFLVYFDFGSAKDRAEKVEVNHHGHRMRQSRCYTASDGKMTCTTCHDPHRKIAKADRVAFYRKKCMQCHQPDDCEMEGMGSTLKAHEADCVSCHMLETRPRDVTEVTITDHKIVRKKPARDLLKVLPPEPRRAGAPLETVVSFPEHAPKGASLALHAHLAKLSNLLPTEIPALKRALAQADPDAAAAYLRTGRLLADRSDHRGAEGVFRDGLAKFPEHAALRFELAMALYRRGEAAEARHEADRSLALDRRPRTLELIGNLFASEGKLPEAKQAFEESLGLRDVRANTWRRYANVLDGLGDAKGALAAFRAALARNPDEPDTYRRLVALHVRQGRIEDARRVLRQGGSRSLAMQLEMVRQLCAGDRQLRDPTEAVRAARTAVVENAKSGSAHLHLAFAQMIVGKKSLARTTLDQARQLGADAASCRGIELFWALQGRDRKQAEELLPRYQNEVRRKSDEPLREPIQRILGALLQRRNG